MSSTPRNTFNKDFLRKSWTISVIFMGPTVSSPRLCVHVYHNAPKYMGSGSDRCLKILQFSRLIRMKGPTLTGTQASNKREESPFIRPL